MSRLTTVQKVAEVAKQTGHGVIHPSNHPQQQRELVKLNQRHNDQMDRLNQQVENKNK